MSRIVEMRIKIKAHNVKLGQGEEDKLMDQPTIEKTTLVELTWQLKDHKKIERMDKHHNKV